ncbi:MAG: segregation/condensation protein A [Acutalibacteraceae bacterium]|nr:segregation/condensation protein A [Acutalibacteraceae bacterium]
MEMVLSYKVEDFEGPLDLLLQLIAKNKLNIYDIKLTVLIDQYLEQIKLMELNDMDIASDFLAMASRLIYIKTVSLLPKHEEVEELKQELTGELLEYQLCREIAAKLNVMSKDIDRFIKKAEPVELDKTYTLTHDAGLIFEAYLAAAGRGKRRLPPSTAPFTKIVAKKIVSVSSKIVYVMRNLFKGGTKKLSSLYSGAKSRSELVATFLAVLELCKANRVKISGEANTAEITLIKEKKK